MHQGKIQQIGTPREIYAHPVNRFVAGFIGKANFLENRLIRITEKEIELEIMGKKIHVPMREVPISEGEKALLVARPESIDLEPKKPGTLTGTILQSVYLGSQMLYEVEVEEKVLSVEIANPQDHIVFSTGEEVSITFNEKSLHVLPYEEDRQ
jgi:iron(III) transport system ATP-binding protein